MRASIGIYDVSSDLLSGTHYVSFQSVRGALRLEIQNGTVRTLLQLYIIIMMCTGLLFCGGRQDLAAQETHLALTALSLTYGLCLCVTVC